MKRFYVMLMVALPGIGCAEDASDGTHTSEDVDVSLAGEPQPCPDAGTCAEAYGDDRLACHRVGDPPYLCGSKSGSCTQGHGECGPDGACVTGFKEFCPECDHDAKCVEVTECGASIPAERCD